MTSLSGLSVDELADGICLRAGRIAAAQAELLMWIAEFDRREGWAGPGMLSCAHWLSWRLGLSGGAAREQVRVARRLEDLPALAEAFLSGRVSFSKARAITRAAEPDDGVDWVALARHSSAAQLEAIVRGVRRARLNEEARTDPELAAWTLRTRTSYDDNGNFTLTISGPAQYLPEIQAGIEARKAELQRERDASAPAEPMPAEPGTCEPMVPEGVSAETPPPITVDLDEQVPGWPAGTTRRQLREAVDGYLVRQQHRVAEESAALDVEAVTAPPVPPRAPESADVSAETPPRPQVTDAEAVLALTQEALAAEKQAHPAVARARRPQLTTLIDPISGWARQSDGELLPPSSLREVMETLPGRGGLLRLRPVTTADLRRHDLGRAQRVVSPALRELLAALDGERCRLPGCTRRKKLHAHHVLHWSDGGPTDLDNLVLVCSRHHTLIHRLGFQLVLHPDRRLSVSTANGVPVLPHPAQPWGDPAELDPARRVCAETLPPDHCQSRLDLRYAVSVLVAHAA